MRTVFISVFQGFISRNILNTGVLDAFLDRGVRVILFVQKGKEAYYKDIYTDDRIVIEGCDLDRLSTKRDRSFRDIAELLLDTNTKRFHVQKRYRAHGNRLRYILEHLFIRTFGSWNVCKKVFRWAEDRYNSNTGFDAYFEKYVPDHVFATDIFGPNDVPLLKSARKHHVHSVGMVTSWDNPTTKTQLRIIPDTILVQNNILRDEMISLHAVDPKKLAVVGIAHYEYYKTYTPISREDFCKEMGINPKKKIILVAPAGEKFISTDWQIFEILKKAYHDGEVPSDVHFLIRVHPMNKIKYGDFVPDEHFTIEEPGVTFEGVREKGNELNKEGVNHIIDSIVHSAVVVNIVSSIVIDASVLGTPIVTVNFDGFEENVPITRSVKRFPAEENVAKMLATGGTQVVNSAEELIQAINEYLEHPGKDSEGRKRLVERQCYKLDGKAPERIVEYVLSEKVAGRTDEK